jgi:hypothetical protein
MTVLLASSLPQLVVLASGLLVAGVLAAIAVGRSGSQRPAPRPTRPAPRPAAGGYARPRLPRPERFAALERMAAERARGR